MSDIWNVLKRIIFFQWELFGLAPSSPWRQLKRCRSPSSDSGISGWTHVSCCHSVKRSLGKRINPKKCCHMHKPPCNEVGSCSQTKEKCLIRNEGLNVTVLKSSVLKWEKPHSCHSRQWRLTLKCHRCQLHQRCHHTECGENLISTLRLSKC